MEEKLAHPETRVMGGIEEDRGRFVYRGVDAEALGLRIVEIANRHFPRIKELFRLLSEREEPWGVVFEVWHGHLKEKERYEVGDVTDPHNLISLIKQAYEIVTVIEPEKGHLLDPFWKEIAEIMVKEEGKDYPLARDVRVRLAEPRTWSLEKQPDGSYRQVAGRVGESGGVLREFAR